MKKPNPAVRQQQANRAQAQQRGSTQRQPPAKAPARAAPTQQRQAPAVTPAKPKVAPQVQPPTPPKQAVAIRKEAAVPAVLDELDEMMQQDAGVGVSTKAEDNIVPNILVLQPLSPEVDEKDAKYIEGAKPGDIYLRGTGVIIPGDVGLWFQPVEMYNKWLEFVPRDSGGGFVAAYDFSEAIDRTHPPEGAERKEDNANRFHFPDSHTECIHYHFVVGFMWEEQMPMEYVIPFKSTGHTVAKGWNTTRLRQRFPNGQSMPAAANLYHLTTARKTNKQGTWYVFEVGAPTFIKSEEGLEVVGDAVKAYTIARSLAGAVASGQKIIAVDDDAPEGGTAGSGDGDSVVYDDVGNTGAPPNEEIPF